MTKTNLLNIYPFIIALSLCTLNLIVMHYHMLYNNILEYQMQWFTYYIDNIFGIGLDVGILFLLGYVLTGRRQKAALWFCFIITWLWSLCNVVYSSFFHSYLSLSAVGQSNSLLDCQILKTILNEIKFEYLYYPICIGLFWFVTSRQDWTYRPIMKIITILVILLILDIGSFAYTYSFRYFKAFLTSIERIHFCSDENLRHPNTNCFRRGCIRKLLYEFYNNIQDSKTLSLEELKAIEKTATKNKKYFEETTSKTTNTNNVIFILVESLMSFTSDIKVNGKEVTPFLNLLKADTCVYYNGQMNDNTTIGESSDGQFIYMTGLLPLRSIITISKAKTRTLPGLPKVLNGESRMIIPTVISLWNQDDMCRQYGFSFLFAEKDHTWINDEQVFLLAKKKDVDCQQSFFSVILTISMHQPYTEQIDSSFLITDPSIDKELACYLNACHYTDKQIAMYFKHLKETGLYDNSLIIITADHPVHNTDFGGVDKHIPLYIINTGIKPDKMWKGECNQLDVYTTILDLMGLKSDWYGLGSSLASPHYENTVISHTWDVSEWIIMGDYFAKKDSL